MITADLRRRIYAAASRIGLDEGMFDSMTRRHIIDVNIRVTYEEFNEGLRRAQESAQKFAWSAERAFYTR